MIPHRSGALVFALVALALTAGNGYAGTTYQVTSSTGKETRTYEVSFGGGKLFGRLTAFDPKSRKFVYLDFRRGSPAPKPAGAIWDHRTGETLPLYQFPGVDQTLPVIPSIEDLRACPFTGARDLKVTVQERYD
jgi:hypothetical protein